MSKEKIRKVMNNNQVRIFTVLFILIAILIIGISVNANKNDDYVVEIKDDGSLNISEDENSSVTKKIVADTPRSLTYEVQIKNLAPIERVPEVAIVIDSSRSMGVNDTNTMAKTKALQLVNELKVNSPRTKISISSNTGVKTGMSTSAASTYITAINGIGYSDSESVEKAISYASGTFSASDTEKYLIIFSDATDSVKEKLETIKNNNVRIYSILTEISNNEYEEMTIMQMVNDIEDYTEIYHRTNKSMINVELTDIFTNEVLEYFDFEVNSKTDDLEIEETSNGYILKCSDIKAGETKTLRYTLTIKDNVPIDSAKVYRTLNSSDKIDIKYNDCEEEEYRYDVENSPTFVICNKYSLTIKAVSEKSNDLPIENLEVKVVGTTVTGQDENGNDIVKTVFNETLTTDSKGRIIIDNLKTLGDIKFEIKPIVNQYGYVETSATEIIVHNDPEGVGTIWAESDISKPDVDVVSRNITVLLPILVQKYEMEIETVNLVDNNIKIGECEYRLIQPKLNSKYEMEALYGTSDSQGKLTFEPAVMTKDGSYQYILTQMNHRDDYDPMGNVTLIVTFENGKVTKIAHQYNENVSTQLISDSKTKVIVGNAPLKEDTFFLEINLQDELTSEKLFGGIYDILVTRTTAAGDQVTTTLNNYITDMDGKIEVEIPGTGYINVKITEKSPKAGYVEDTVVKEITFLRKNGTVQYISSKNPTNLDVIADTDNNTIRVNLKSKLANEQNRIQVHLVDDQEQTANIPGVLLAINKVGSTDLIYATTDINGIANFIIPNEEAGNYQYEISLFVAAPSGYIKPSTDQLGIINVQYGSNKHIVAVSNVSNTAPTMNTSFEQILEEGFLYDTAKVDLSLAPDPAYSYQLKISLLDGSTNKGLAGGKYSILMESDGVEVKYLSGKLTDNNGNYTTRIVGGGENITITITETATVPGYILTTTTQVIELELTDSGYVISNSGPNVYDPANGQKIGAELVNKQLIYHDVNNSKTGANTILNLHVNKMDTSDLLVSGVKVKLNSDTLLGSDGKPLDEIREVTNEDGTKEQRDYYITDQNGYFEILGIKVKGDELNNGERIDYLYINEIDKDGNIIDNTDITLKLTFRLNKNTNVVEITNVEATWGNRLVKSRTYSSRETDVAYESDVYLDLYTNFDDVGNFSLDLKKVDKNGKILPGAKYDIVVTRPDSTTLVRRDINVNNNVELEGILVSKGTKIEITEKQAPIGYNVNQYTEVITITDVNELTGLVTCELEPSSYSTPRAEIISQQPIVSSEGAYKLCITLELTDYEMDTFKFGVKAQDSEYKVPIQGYKFNIYTSEGAQKNSPATNNDGKTSVQIGANYKIDNYEVTYTVDTLTVANYYKKLANPIQVKVIFDLNGNIKTNETIAANQAQAGYGTIWTIEATNTVDGNDIDILINIDHCDPLVVNIQTEDIVTNQAITNIEYKIDPSVNIQAQGTTNMQVGYIVPNTVQTYTINQTNGENITAYGTMPQQQFKVEYDENGNIVSGGTTAIGSYIEVVSTNGKTINLKIKMLPKLIVNIQTVDAITNNPVTNIQYKITPSEKVTATGNTKVEVGYVKTNKTGVAYTVEQITNLDNYGKLANQGFTVDYDNLGKITSATATTDKIEIIETNNNTIKIKLSVEPALPFVITNEAYFDQTPLANSTFEISLDNQNKEIVTAGNGIGINYLGELGTDNEVTYNVKQKIASTGYSTVEDFKVKVTYDSERNVIGAELIGTVNNYVDFVEVSYKQPSTSSDTGYNGNGKGIINIKVRNYPEVQFRIENVDRTNEEIKLAGTTYDVVSTINTKAENIVTDSNGIAIARLDKGTFATTITYTIKEKTSASMYQSLIIDPVIEVTFDREGFITDTTIIKRSDAIEITKPEPITEADKLKLNITIKNNPKLKVAITKVDEEDENILIPNVNFELTARITKENLNGYTEEEIQKLTLNTSTLTEEDYLSQVIDRLKINDDEVEEIKKSIALQNLITELKNNNNLTAQEEEEINNQTNTSKKLNKIVELGKATKTQINQKVNAVKNSNVINKLIENGTTTQDRVNDLLNIVKNQLRLDANNITTNNNGYAVAYMDKTLENKTIEYTLKETKKAKGYDWLDEVIIFEVTYDAEGKMVSEDPVKLISGQIEITPDVENFRIEAKVKNKPSQEVYIHLAVEDVYDADKKLETAKFDAYLISKEATVVDSYIPDNKYRVTLQTGSTTSGTGLVTAHGEDSECLGVYEEGAGKRTLRLVQKQTPSSYYLGTNQYSSVYQSIAYAILIDVTFDDEGKILGTNLHAPGSDTQQIGYVADGRYIEVSNTKNTINITVKYYPMLQVQMQTVDKYTKQSLKANYTIDTDDWADLSANLEPYQVKSGYINPHPVVYGKGRTYRANYTTNASLTDINNASRVAVSPTEAESSDTKERILYVYEKAEPNAPIQYQTYLPRHIATSGEYLLAKIKVKYDGLGQVQDVEVIQTKSSNNIKSGFFTTVKATTSVHTIQIIVEYAPITTIRAKVIDEVSGAGLSGIRINPYLGGTHTTSTSYENRSASNMYYTTGNSGTTGWTYWGASEPNAQNRYIIDTYTTGSGYEGYFDPGVVMLDVSYDENGRIASVTPKSTDAFGDVNAINVSWSNNNIQVTIRYCRKFNIKLNKVDYNDSNKKLNAVFTITSSQNTTKSIAANTTTTLGKVYPGKIVNYTLSETTIPNGYIPIENLDIKVEFKNNGTIKEATSTSPYYQFVSSAPLDAKTNSLKKTDLIANIKNKPRFDVSIQLADKFYPTLKLQGGAFTIENSKGDMSAGGLQTDGNGILQTYVGTVYPNEEITYTVRQTNVIPGYYENNTVMKFKVHFNANGKIDAYSLVEGTDVATMNPSNHIGKQAVRLNVTNKPKDIKLGISKYDGLTSKPIEGIQFTVKAEEAGKKTSEKTIVTNANGAGVDIVDTFVEKNTNRVVTYTISEIKAAKTYRKIQDIVVKVTYKPDGSLYLYDVLSNPSKVGVEIATNGQIKYTADTPVHIKLTIPNDNAYDVIVKNEDTNYEGLGIAGTEYDISINGVNKGPITTNANGIASVNKQTQNGNITIVVTERNIGEGYRADNNNTTTIQVEKGIEEYTLQLLDNSNPTYATVEVDEELGIITVTFKNETKLELTMQKEDINTGTVLKDVEFEIKEIELDSSGNEIEGTEKMITTEETQNITDIKGLLYFDLGLSKQNKTIKYTFTEITPPEGYTPIFPIEVVVKFDAYGHIIEMKDNTIRAKETLASNTGKSHHMIVVIGNGTINEQYTVKIITEDSTTSRRINGSIFQVKALETATNSVNKSITGATKDVTSMIAGEKYVFEQGVLKVEGITAEGEVDIQFNQIETATGYVYGENQTSGSVKVKAEFTLLDNETEKQVELSLIEDNGFDVEIDNINRQITIKVLNEPQATFEITKVDADTKGKMQNVKFHITAATFANGTTTPTGLDENLPLTDKNGYSEINVGIPYAGQTVIYTLSEEKIEEYDKLEDIILSVQYDINGNIVAYNILSSPDDITVKEQSQKSVLKRVMTDDDLVGVVNIDYTTIQIPTGIGSRILQMEINNYKTPIPKDYQIQIGKYHEDTTYPYLIPGAKYEITVKQEYGKESTTWVDITDENGIILSPYFSGHGLIEIMVKEVESPEGYKLDGVTRTTRLIRYENSQKMVIQSTDSGCIFNEDFTMVYLKAVDEVVSGLYDIVINKVDVKSGALIVQNPAQIKVEAVEEHKTITQEIDDETGEIVENTTISTVRVPIIEQETDANGRIVANKLKAPSIPGDYTYILSETKAPTGYNGIKEQEVEIVVTFEENEYQEMIITNVVVKDAEDVRAARTSNKVMNIIVYNEDGNYDDVTLADNEIAIDLRKVDDELYQVTTTIAQFTFTDLETNEEATIITDELGRAEVLKLKMPEEAGNYKYKLKETLAPKGYKKIEEDMYILMEFAENEEGKIYLKKVSTEGANLLYANTPKEGELPDRKLSLKVINEHLPYTLIIEKHHESDPYYPYYIQGVEFDIKVKPEYGEEIEWTDITNKDGIIIKEALNGYGRIRVEITEKAAPDKYKLDTQTKFVEFYREKGSKELREYDSNVNYELDENNQKIILKPVNELSAGIYDIVINKVDKTNNTTITNNPAEFNLYMVNKYSTEQEDGQKEITEVKVPIIQNEKTDNLGILIKDSVKIAKEEGTYTFELEEVQAPEGYEGLKEPVRFEVTLSLDGKGDLIITDVKITSQTENVKLLAYRDKLISLSVANNNGIPEGSISIDISKVDNDGKPITVDTAVFKVTDEQTHEVLSYIETIKETGNGYMYINKPAKPGDYTYTINEIKAPQGYAVDTTPITVKITYEQNEEGGLYIAKAQVEGSNIIYEEPEEGKVPANRVALKVKNEIGQAGNANDKPYTVVINKIDELTKEHILERATFDVALVNGEVVHASTNEKGQMIIENVHMPAIPGEYEILIKETKEPSGYILDPEVKVLKVTFNGIAKNMEISNLELGETNNTNIEIVTQECTQDKIVLNILNKSEDEPLYVVSKKYESGQDIYDVLQSFTGKDYSIDKPFIDTKVAKYGNNVTAEEFINNLESNGVMTVLDKNGNEISPTSRVKTGMTLRAVKGNQELRFTIVVKGDCNEDGRVLAVDVHNLEKHLTGEKVITDPIRLRALDLTKNYGDGTIRAVDLSQLYKVMTE